jgi:hypothetical protein
VHRNRGVDRHRHQLGRRFLWAAHQEAPASAPEQGWSIRRQSFGVATYGPTALPPLAKGDEAMKTSHPTVLAHQVVSRGEWLQAREELLIKEKELTRLRDGLSRQRRELPWVKVAKRYVFDGPHGRQTLAELFARRSQLIVYHFMFGPGWVEGCRSCSFLADHIDGTLGHLEHHDVSLVVVSRAPRLELEAFKKRKAATSRVR